MVLALLDRLDRGLPGRLTDRAPKLSDASGQGLVAPGAVDYAAGVRGVTLRPAAAAVRRPRASSLSQA